jgi:hypothetical protein
MVPSEEAKTSLFTTPLPLYCTWGRKEKIEDHVCTGRSGAKRQTTT